MRFILLNKELKRIRDLNSDNIIKPLVVQDYNTGEHKLEFSFPLEDPADVINGDQVILCEDEDGELVPFKVVETDITAQGTQVMFVRAEHLFYELSDGLVKTYSRVNDTAEIALAYATDGTRWQVGNVDESITDLKSYAGSYHNPLQVLRNIEDTFEARLKFRVELGKTVVDGMYVDMHEIDVQFSGQRFEFNHNLTDIDITVDHSQVKTALTGLSPGAGTDPVTGEPIPLTFASAEWSIADGDPADKPLNQTWVGNEEAKQLYGIYNPEIEEMEHRFGLYDTSAAETAEGLLQATWLIGTRRHFSPKINIEAKVADLSQVKFIDIKTGSPVKLDHEKIRLGNICYVMAEHKGLLAAMDVRIIRVERYLKEPGNTVVIFGDVLFTVSEYIKELEDSIDARVKRAQPDDRGPGATVTIASQDTSNYPEYADIVVPEGMAFDAYFADAVSRITVNGGHILILEGLYTYEDTLVVDKNNLTISGQGEGTVIKLADNRTAATNGLYAVGVDGLQIRDIVFEGNKDNQEDYETYEHIGIKLLPEVGETFTYLWDIIPGDTIQGDLAWYRETSNKPPWNSEFGYRFKSTVAARIIRLRWAVAVTRSLVITLWDANTGAAVNSVTVSAQDAQWGFIWLNPGWDIDANKEYRISHDYYSGEDFVYAICEDGAGSGEEHLIVDSDWVNSPFELYFPATGALKIDGPAGAYPANASSNAVYAFIDPMIASVYEGNRNISLRNVTVKNYNFSGIHTQGLTDSEVINCRSVNNRSGLLLRSDGVWVTNSRVLGCEFNNNGQLGLYVQQGSDLLIEHNSIVGNGNAGIMGTFQGSAITNNTVQQVDDTGDFVLAGINMVMSSGNNVSGNLAVGCKYWGIIIDWDSDHNIINNNVFSDSSESSGMWVEDSNYNTIQGNKCTGNKFYGISIESGQANQVTNNDLSGNSSGGLNDGGTATITAAGNRS